MALAAAAAALLGPRWEAFVAIGAGMTSGQVLVGRAATSQAAPPRRGHRVARPQGPGGGDSAVGVIDDEFGLEELERKVAGEAFDWAAQWYPVALAADLDAAKPNAVMLLGEDLVLWHDGKQWVCFRNSCPHRLAPLSEGRVVPADDGDAGRTNLQCAYHGWEFCGAGGCKRVPQATSQKMEHAAMNSPRASPVAYPVREEVGLLWVWPSASAPPTEELPIPGALKESLRAGQGQPHFYLRDLPYGHDVLLENLVDPSHLQFSHHGIGNLRREQVVAGHRMELVRDFDTLFTRLQQERNIEGPRFLNRAMRVAQDSPLAAVRTKAPFGPPTNMNGFLHFTPPGRVIFEYPFDFTIVLFAVPTAPGVSRVFMANLAPRPMLPPGRMIRLKRRARRVLSRLRSGNWLGLYRRHLDDHGVFDGDGIFLTSQQHKLHHDGGSVHSAARSLGSPHRAYFMPTPADSLVLAMRRWYEGSGGLQPTWRGGAHRAGHKDVPPPMEQLIGRRDELLDRWGQHTQHCKICKQAHRRLRRGFKASTAVPCGVAAWWLGALGAGAVAPVSGTTAGALFVIASGAWLRRWVRRELQRFKFEDYVHADK